MNRTHLLASAALFAMLGAAPVHAQESAQTEDAARPSGGLEDIVVTAQKRAENVQDVPISINAVTAASVAQSGIRTSQDLAVAVPSLSVTRTTSATTFFIRGIGTQGGQTGLEGAVATFVDGVYQPSLAGSTLALNNIERLEVLKGPQGTLFGRNATGGALNIITRTPSVDTHVEGAIGYGNHDTIEGSFYGTTGSGPGAVDLAIYYNNQRDGFGKNLTTGNDVNKTKDFAIRSKIYLELGDDTTLTVAGDYSYVESSIAIAYRAIPTSSSLDGSRGWAFGYYDSISEFDQSLHTRIAGGSAKLEHNLGDFKLTSISAYRYLKGFQRVDVDALPIKVVDAPLYYDNGQFTQELQVAYDSDRLNAIFGLFYLKGYDSYEPFQIVGAAVAPAERLRQQNQQNTTSIAAFGQATYEVFEDTRLTLGARYTRDKRRLNSTGELVIVPGTPPVTVPLPSRNPDIDPTAKFTSSKPTWRLALDHKFTPDILGYVSYSRGFKSGAYNLTSPFDPAVKPETLDAYEAGVKSELFDRHLRLNIAGFYYTYDNIQLTLVKGASTLLVNAAKAETYGIDADFDAALTDGLSLRGGVSVIHARYKNFPDAPNTTPNFNPPFGNTVVAGDAKGQRILRVPEFTFNAAINYKVELAGGELASNISYAYNGGFYWNPDNRVKQKAFSLVNAQMVYTFPDGHYNVRIWGRNITKTKYLLSVDQNNTGDIGVPAPGRTFGASFGFNF